MRISTGPFIGYWLCAELQTAAVRDTEVRCWVVSTSTYPAPVLPAGSTMGDQLWLMPLARNRYPLAWAQLASVTMSLAPQVQTLSMAIIPAQF